MKSLITFTLLISVSLGVLIPATDPLIDITGRVLVEEKEKSVQFDWSGIEIAAAFNGTSISAVMSDPGGVYNVFIDGELVQVLNASRKVDSYVLAQGLSGEDHVLLMTKRTEASFWPGFGVVTFSGLSLDEGASLLPRYKSDRFAHLQAGQSTRRIEFVGDSITCGFGDMGEVPCTFSAATENNYDAWGAVIARHFDAEYHVESWSGKGVIRNCCKQNITTPDPLPAYWGRTIASRDLNDWNFSSWVPDALVINLGTNDYSTEPTPPQSLFEEGYISFVKTIINDYSTDLHVFLACGPMIANPCCEYVQNVVASLNSTLNVHYIDLMEILTYPQDFGCNGHPNFKGHAIMAEYAIPVIQKYMGW